MPIRKRNPQKPAGLYKGTPHPQSSQPLGLAVCRRREGLSREDYGRRILNSHVPLALEHHPSMRRYRVNLVERPRGESLVPVDSIAELSFATREDFRERLYATEEGRRLITADTATFLGSAAAYETTEYVQKAPDIPDQPLGAEPLLVPRAAVRAAVAPPRSAAASASNVCPDAHHGPKSPASKSSLTPHHPSATRTPIPSALTVSGAHTRSRAPPVAPEHEPALCSTINTRHARTHLHATTVHGSTLS